MFFLLYLLCILPLGLFFICPFSFLLPFFCPTSSLEVWVRRMFKFPAVFHHSGCQFWLLQDPGITVNETILLSWYIISLFMHYLLPSYLYLCIPLSPFFFLKPILTRSAKKDQTAHCFFILILTAVLFNHWERRVCIPVFMQMINSHTDYYMLQHIGLVLIPWPIIYVLLLPLFYYVSS